MANSFKLNGVQLNSTQLRALLSVPITGMQFNTYWALKQRGLIQGAQHTTAITLTDLGAEVIAAYRKQVNGGKA